MAARTSEKARRHGLPALPPDPQILGLYVAACASGAITGKPDSVATLERRISALKWNFAQRGETFDRADRHVATVLAGVRRTQGRPPEQKEAILPEDLLAMIATLDLRDLRGLRDRAILLLGFAGGLGRSEIVGLDCGARQTRDGTGWTEILDKGVLVTLRPRLDDGFLTLLRFGLIDLARQELEERHSASAAFSITAATSVAWTTSEAWLPATSVVWACILAANIFWASGAITLSFVLIT
jgi:integrase